MPETRYRNIVFDLGNVLLKADLAGAILRIAEQSSSSPAEITRLFEESDIIDRFDIGRLSPEEFHLEVAQALGWRGSFEELRTIWEGMLSPDDEMIVILHRMKSQGYATYILSNINPIHLRMMDRTFGFIREVDGVVYSCECGMIKPEAGIFLHLIETFKLTPRETIFIDDKEANVRVAAELGIHSIQHNSTTMTLESIGRLVQIF